ncbi:MAG: hypothetical protein M1834_001883 [Cirrosporium novae-zelandiae]|nr:MAG: hypothetical protein M1834_001883 [Cirrosporium novae-zelandiae]
MNSSTLRRLASDHAALHKKDLPPYYLFPAESADISDDLTQLMILLTGPSGTPYSQGVWKLFLRIPNDYPKNPPKASFRTRIWHPNVEESTGSICVDTLKRDWDPKLTLRDILITISCLLIQPNPDSALNPIAGQLLQEDYQQFAQHARLMTSIHASIPPNLKSAVMEAKSRGDDIGAIIHEDREVKTKANRKTTGGTHKVIMKNIGKADNSFHATRDRPTQIITNGNISRTTETAETSNDEDEEDEENAESASKENDPTLSPSPVPPPPSPRKSVLGKRPLSDLPTPMESEFEDDEDDENMPGLTSSEKNIAKNITQETYPPSTHSHNHNRSRSHQLDRVGLNATRPALTMAEPPRKTLKLSEIRKDINTLHDNENASDDLATLAKPAAAVNNTNSTSIAIADDSKENSTMPTAHEARNDSSNSTPLTTKPISTTTTIPNSPPPQSQPQPTLKPTNPTTTIKTIPLVHRTAKPRPKARIGVRRL